MYTFTHTLQTVSIILLIFLLSLKDLASNAGTKLVKKGQFHVGSRIIKLIRFAASYDIQGLYYFTVDGSIGVILPAPEKLFKRLQMIFSRMTNLVQLPFALNSRAYRSWMEDESMMGVSSTAAKSILDCNLMKIFTYLGRHHQREIVQFVGTTIPTVFKDFAFIFAQINKF